MNKVLVCVLDGVGAGEAPDADAYGDRGSNTLRHVLEGSNVELPNLAALGLGKVVGLPLGAPRSRSTYGRLLERGAGKDTTTGHWEMMGLALERPFPTYPDGFPAEVIEPFTRAIGRGVLGNRPASGTAIIEELGDEHLRSGRPIVYTSADSVFQVACHEDVVPPALLYEWCAIARRILSGRHAVGRVIARPFAGVSGAYERTPRRRDFSLSPTGPTYLDLLHDAEVPVIGVGKIGEIFAQRGVDVDDHTTNNTAGLAACRRHLQTMTRRPAVRQPGRFRPDLGASQRRCRLCPRAARSRRGRARPAPRARARRPRDLVRRPRRRPDHGEHRPLPRVRAAAGLGPARRALRWSLRGRRGDRLPVSHRPRAAARRVGHP